MTCIINKLCKTVYIRITLKLLVLCWAHKPDNQIYKVHKCKSSKQLSLKCNFFSRQSFVFKDYLKRIFTSKQNCNK